MPTVPAAATPPPPLVFMGSSSEGLGVLELLEHELGALIRSQRWDKGVFVPSTYVMPSLIQLAPTVDFAILIATPDDVAVKRGETYSAARDNVILEYGLFAGVLGHDRTFLVTTRGIGLPTDTLGLNAVHYSADREGRDGVRSAAFEIKTAIRRLGPRDKYTSDVPATQSNASASRSGASNKVVAERKALDGASRRGSGEGAHRDFPTKNRANLPEGPTLQWRYVTKGLPTAPGKGPTRNRLSVRNESDQPVKNLEFTLIDPLTGEPSRNIKFAGPRGPIDMAAKSATGWTLIPLRPSMVKIIYQWEQGGQTYTRRESIQLGE